MRRHGRQAALRLYCRSVLQRPGLLSRLPELEGKTLRCHCRKQEACHADVLIRLWHQFCASSVVGVSTHGNQTSRCSPPTAQPPLLSATDLPCTSASTRPAQQILSQGSSQRAAVFDPPDSSLRVVSGGPEVKTRQVMLSHKPAAVAHQCKMMAQRERTDFCAGRKRPGHLGSGRQVVGS